MLHAPDFLGYPGAVEMARDHREIVRARARAGKAGNAVMATIGGRAVHPVNVRVGGFYRVPAARRAAPLAEQLRGALDLAVETVRWVAGFEFPEFSCDHELLSLQQPGSYPIDEGTLVTSGGLDFGAAEFERARDRGAGAALHGAARAAGRASGYLTGPLARYTLNSRWLPPLAAGRPRGRAGRDLPQPVPQHRRPGGRDGRRDARRRCA